MSDFLNLDTTKARFITADKDNSVRITNVTNTTVYYDDASTVSASSNDGSLTQGQSVLRTVGTYLLPLANAQILLEYVPGFAQVGKSAKSRFNTMDVATATSGTDTACTNGDVWAAGIFVPASAVLTGIEYLIGSVGTTTKVIAILYDSSGTVVANSALAGATVGTAANLQQVAFTAVVGVAGPAKYFIALQFDGTNAKFRSIPAFCGQRSARIKQTGGTFGTLAPLSPIPTALVDAVGPIASTY